MVLGTIARQGKRIFPWSDNNHGAAVLLAVYLTALVLLLLCGVALQRTNNDVRAAQLSRNLHQAFWAAEAALENALTQLPNSTLTDNTNYPVSVAPLMANTSFQLFTLGGEVMSTTTQRVTRQIQALSSFAASTTPVTVNGFTDAIGALRGVWADGYIVVHGGRNHPGAFVTGNLYSSLGALVSVVPSGNTLVYEGLVNADKIGLQNPNTATAAQKLTAMSSPQASSAQLQDVKTTYLKLEGLKETTNSIPPPPQLQFVQSTTTANSIHVNGLLSVGMADIDTEYSKNACHVVFTPPMGQVTDVYDGFRGGNDLRDIGPTGDNHINLCVRAIVPGDPSESVPQGQPSAEGLKALLLPADKRRFPFLASDTPTTPTELRFHSPATIYIVGQQSFDLPELQYLSPDINTTWNVSLAMKISTVNDLDPSKPPVVNIIQAKPRLLDTRYQPGMYFLRPGGPFAGLVYSPHSLIVTFAREQEDQLGGPIYLQSIVGHEVVVEVESDSLEVGSTMADGSKIPPDQVSLVGWSN